MIKLNLTANTEEEKLVKQYLEENASEVLAQKINNGTPFTKDNKPLINKKDLKGFMRYAGDEARKLAEKGANCACVNHTTVFGWAIHYFEEDSIEGKLYNQDGTEYKPPIKQIENTSTPIRPQIVKTEPNPQPSLFDLFTEPKVEPDLNQETEQEDENPEIIEEREPIEEISESEFVTVGNQVVDATTGEVIKQADNDTIIADLYSLFDGVLEVNKCF